MKFIPKKDKNCLQFVDIFKGTLHFSVLPSFCLCLLASIDVCWFCSVGLPFNLMYLLIIRVLLLLGVFFRGGGCVSKPPWVFLLCYKIWCMYVSK